MPNRKIALVGCDLDLVDDIKENKTTNINIVGYFSDSKKSFMPWSYIGNIKEQKTWLAEFDYILIACDDISIRKYCLLKYRPKLASYISSSAKVMKSATLGVGVVIMPNTYISFGAKIGDCSKINVGGQIHHQAIIESCCVMGPRATLLGGAKVKKGSYIGASATIRENRYVGKNTIIGMGSVVVKNIKDNAIAFGNPCIEQQASADIDSAEG